MAGSVDASGTADAAPPVFVRVRVKSRTGDAYYRGSRSWPANAWARVEVTEEELAILAQDRWLDVIPLDDADVLDQKELTVDEQLAAANKEIAALRAETASLKEAATVASGKRGK